MSQIKHHPIDIAELRRRLDPALIPFETSDKAPECTEAVLGQARAKEALEFGLAMKSPGYHVYVAGPDRTGKTHLVRSVLEQIAAGSAPPPDWVYVHNFRDKDKPRALKLPTGMGREFAGDMKNLVIGLKLRIPALFESDEYSKRKESLVADFQRKRSSVFQGLDQQAREVGYVLRFEEGGIMVAPADEDGQPLEESAIREMNDEQRAELRDKSDVLQGKVAESLRKVGAAEKALTQSLKRMDRDTVLFAVNNMLEELVDKYTGQGEVLSYLTEVQNDVADNYEFFAKKPQQALQLAPQPEENRFKRYEVNVFVDNSEATGAPIVVESNPTFPNIFGRIERQAQFGALVTDFTMLTPGSIHRANGGYLVLPILEMLQLWMPWQGLKRALRDGEAAMEDAMEQLGYLVTRSLRPQPIPLDIKVILVGDNILYRMLHTHDHQFSKIFKVRAQMSDRMDWQDEEIKGLLSHLCQQVKDEGLLPIARDGAAALVELAAEFSGDRERLTLRLAEVEDMVREADYVARKQGREVITAEGVAGAVAQRRRRVSMMESRIRESVTRGFIKVRTSGEEVGQVNGLAVLDIGDHVFGSASRISAAVGLGKEGVVAVDRQSDLSGPFHTKGVLILGGFLRDRFGGDGPLALTASLVFEQSYSMIDGDSASMAELLALMSRLSGAPLRQDLAVTGSVSQRGEMQAIGGVNHKIEGFYRLCAEQGLTGEQGAVIPASNVKNLMLHPEVVQAVADGKFNVYAVNNVDEALELMTGVKAGVRQKNGLFTVRSINRRVADELKRMAELARDKTKKKKK